MEQLKVNSIIKIPVSFKKNFFEYWLEFLAPFHHLTPKELSVASAFLRKRYELSKSITDPITLDKMLFSADIKKQIKDECGLITSHFYAVLGKLRRVGLIKDNKINPKFIPKNVTDSSKSFKLLLYFDISE